MHVMIVMCLCLYLSPGPWAAPYILIQHEDYNGTSLEQIKFKHKHLEAYKTSIEAALCHLSWICTPGNAFSTTSSVACPWLSSLVADLRSANQEVQLAVLVESYPIDVP